MAQGSRLGASKSVRDVDAAAPHCFGCGEHRVKISRDKDRIPVIAGPHTYKVRPREESHLGDALKRSGGGSRITCEAEGLIPNGSRFDPDCCQSHAPTIFRKSRAATELRIRLCVRRTSRNAARRLPSAPLRTPVGISVNVATVDGWETIRIGAGLEM
jgi:hypothetical protein